MGMTMEELQDMIAGAHLTDWNKELADPNSLVKLNELQNRTLWLWDINDTTIDDVSRYIIAWNREDHGKKKEDRTPIRIYCFSDGGFNDDAFNLINLLEISETDVYTYNMGKAYSAGFLIFLAGKKGHRYTFKHATFMTHQGGSSMAGSFGDLDSSTKSYREDIKWMKNFILTHSKIPAKTLSSNWKNAFFFNTEQAIEYGVADKVIESMDELFE